MFTALPAAPLGVRGGQPHGSADTTCCRAPGFGLGDNVLTPGGNKAVIVLGFVA